MYWEKKNKIAKLLHVNKNKGVADLGPLKQKKTFFYW